MKILIVATQGVAYSFAGIPTIKYTADCGSCPESYDHRYKEFTSAEARNRWVRAHEQIFTTHKVGVSTEVTA